MAVLANSCSPTEKGHWPLRGVSSHSCQAISCYFTLSVPCFWIWGEVRVHRLGTGWPVRLLWGHLCSCHWPQNCAWSVTLINSFFPQGELWFVVVSDLMRREKDCSATTRVKLLPTSPPDSLLHPPPLPLPHPVVTLLLSCHMSPTALYFLSISHGPLSSSMTLSYTHIYKMRRQWRPTWESTWYLAFWVWVPGTDTYHVFSVL